MAARNWTLEQREQQAAKIHHWKPWNKSTGAKTLKGKAIISKNWAIGATKRELEIEQAKIEFFAALNRMIKLTERRDNKNRSLRK